VTTPTARHTVPERDAPAVKSTDVARILSWAQQESPAMVELLERLAETAARPEPQAHRTSFALLAEQLEGAGLAVRAVHDADAGRLYARPPSRRRGTPHQLVLGHLDAGPRPGAVGAQGGLVVLSAALRALAALGLEPPLAPVVFVNAAADSAGVDATRLLRRLARGAARALVVEPDRSGLNRLTFGRSGVGRFTLVLRGDAARSVVERKGSGFQSSRLLALDDPRAGVFVEITADPRPRRDEDGLAVLVDVRAATRAGARRVAAAIRALGSTAPHGAVEVRGGFLRPPLEPVARNRLLFGAAVRLGHELGLELGDAGPDGGVETDAHTTSLYTATLDGLGPVVRGAGTADEQVVLASLPERAALLALLLLEPPLTLGPPTRHAHRRLGRVAFVGSDANTANVDLVTTCEALGITADLVGAGEVRPGDTVFGRLDVLPTLDGIEPGLLQLLLLERRGVRVLNGAPVLARAHDKLLTARALARASLPHPRTAHLVPGRPLPQLAPPIVVKPRFGSWGADVFRCDTWEDVESCLLTIVDRGWFRRHGAIVQELVPPAGHDLRVVVASGLVVGGISRIAAPGEWRTNTSLGGSVAHVELPEPARQLALAAAASIGADLVGVDLLPLDGGYTIIELNGAVEFDAGYSPPGGDIFAATIEALGLVPAA
jgi:glutamate carboxypeptidase